jgi:hypothetical protein
MVEFGISKVATQGFRQCRRWRHDLGTFECRTPQLCAQLRLSIRSQG